GKESVDRHNARIITLPLMPPGVPQHGEPYTLPLVVTYLRRPVDEVVAYLQTELLLPGAAFRRLGRVEAVEDLLPRPGGEGEWEESLRLRCSRLPCKKGHRVLEHWTPGQLGKTFVVGSAEQALHRVRALPELHPHGRALRYPPLPWHRSEERAVRSEEHTSELQSRENLVCRLLLEKKKKKKRTRQETPRA